MFVVFSVKFNKLHISFIRTASL